MKTNYTVFGDFTEVGRKKAEEVIQKIKDNGGNAYIGKTWFDYDKDLYWTTIIAESESEVSRGMKFQLLDPVDKEQMDLGIITDARLNELVARVR